MKIIATLLLLACVGCGPDKDAARKQYEEASRIESESKKRVAKFQGDRAYRVGVPSTANPHSDKSHDRDALREAWLDGWIEAAERDANKNLWNQTLKGNNK